MTASKHPPSRLRRGGALATAAALSLTMMSAVGAASAEPPLIIVEDFESGLPSGTDGDGVPIGFFTFNGAGSSVAVSTVADPAPVPDDGVDGQVLQMDVDVTSYAGVINAFANDALTEWVPQDWSASKGITMWLYGQGSGTTLFVDVLENRNPGSTTDDAERWSVDIIDNFTGWKEISIPFSSLTRKGVGNGAPDDGWEGTEVHGWALGALGTGGPRTYWVDNVGVYGVAEIPELAVGFSARNFNILEGETGDIAVKLNRSLRDEDPDQVTVEYTVEPGAAVPDRDFIPTSGTLTFVEGGPRELTFPLETIDNMKDDGDRRVILRLASPVGALAGIMQAAGTILDDEPYDPLLLDDFERAPDLWDASDVVTLTNPEIAASDPDAVPGQGAWEHVLQATVGGPIGVDIQVQGRVCNQGNGIIPVYLLSTPTFDATTVDHTTVMLGDAYDSRIDKKTGLPRRQERDVNRDGLTDLVFQFRFRDTGLECDPAVLPLTGETYDGQAITTQPDIERFGRDFALGEDWSGAESLSFWYEGTGSGNDVTVEVLDNRAPDPGPAGWSLVWADEFDEPAGTLPNPDNWGYEIGDGTVNGIPGWGNSELQYYTDSPENAATDGVGNLVITAREADGELCYYGECDYTSARLLSKHKAEFAYGRIEASVQVPDGAAGLWPAFWSLGTDIDRVGWPQTGEIDIMEYVSRIPDEVFGTIHGPGYSGGDAFGNILNVPGGVPGPFRTYAIEWQPDRIEWYLDDTLYHTATPADVAPNEWVFNDPVFLLLNMAIGGSFGGAVSEDLTMPQEMKVDYVRVYQGPDTAERFEASFVDDFTGWQQVTIPFADLERSADAYQPAGAPSDGLQLTDVWGYGFRVESGSGDLRIDQVRLVPTPDTTPPELTITDNVPEGAATRNVTFTFSFSEDVGDTFDASDVQLTGGTMVGFTRVDGDTATLVARPPADATGVLEVSVAAGAFSDLAGNPSVTDASAQQAFDTPPLPTGDFVITFDEVPPPGVAPFEGAAGGIAVDPTDASNRVAEIVKGTPDSPSQPWAGATIHMGDNFTVPAIPFSPTDSTITVRVWSPKPAGSRMMLKVENAAGQAAEVEALTTVEGGWQDLTFDFAGKVDPAVVYNKVSFFPDFMTAGSGQAYYIDDLSFPAPEPITFSEVPPPLLTGFGGANGTVTTDPTDATNMVAEIVKGGPETWAGVVVSTGNLGDIFWVPAIRFLESTQTLTLRIWSPKPVGTPVLLKVENAADAGQFAEVTALTTVQAGWQTLSFDFTGKANPALGYNKVIVFPDFGTAGTGETYYLDDITFP